MFDNNGSSVIHHLSTCSSKLSLDRVVVDMGSLSLMELGCAGKALCAIGFSRPEVKVVEVFVDVDEEEELEVVASLFTTLPLTACNTDSTPYKANLLSVFTANDSAISLSVFDGVKFTLSVVNVNCNPIGTAREHRVDMIASNKLVHCTSQS